MITGECPYCRETVCNAIPEDVDLPCIGEIPCEHCGEKYWLKFSRFEPKAYTQDSFNEEYNLSNLERITP